MRPILLFVIMLGVAVCSPFSVDAVESPRSLAIGGPGQGSTLLAESQGAASAVRRSAAVQVIRPSGTPGVWEWLGSQAGIEWFVLGRFEVLSGSLPERSQGGGLVPMRFVVGRLSPKTGAGIDFVVASITDVGDYPQLPVDALLFNVHTSSRTLPSALLDAERRTLESRAVEGLDLGTDSTSSAAPPLEALFAPLGNCENLCQTAYSQKAALCDSTYTTCAGAATVGLTVCLAACAPTGPGCTVCAVTYAIALAVCDSNRNSCLAAGRADYDACVGNCPDGPDEPCYENCTPVVINLEGAQGFRFTSASDGVQFDLDGNGWLNRTAWTDGSQRAAFVVMDRNGNGTIDDGTELFGAVTAQPASVDPNGFRALAVLDDVAAGGDGDGWLTPSDAGFHLLALWIDTNHDGLSQPSELTDLRTAEVVAIALDYVVSERRDRYGNLLRYKSLVRMHSRTVEAVDVLLVQAEEE